MKDIEEGSGDKVDAAEDKPAKNGKMSVGSIMAAVRKTVGSATSKKRDGDSEPKVRINESRHYN